MPDAPTLTAAQAEALRDEMEAVWEDEPTAEEIELVACMVRNVAELVAGWLAEARAEAWSEGYNALRDMAGEYDEQRGFLNRIVPTNPYREATP